ncbi:hypothetical protein VNPA141826_44560 [Pseudomonas aeruginosa]|nr:hypothetical protein VNPA141826_44560 [Pseudomonas aeruginosa]
MTDRAAPSNWMLALLACAQLIIALDATIVFVALPEISRALDFSAQRLQWVVSAYTVAFGGFLLLGGPPPTCSAGAACTSSGKACTPSPPSRAAWPRASCR